MVSHVQREAGRLRFVLRPNCSATWFQIKIFFAALATVSLGIATLFTLAGFWPVLPFAGAELAFVGACLWATASRSERTEVIDIDDATVAVECGRRHRERRWQFPRPWAQVRLVPSPVRMHPSRLLVGSHGRLVHLGAFLTETERRQLAKELRAAITPVPAPTNNETLEI